VVDGCGGESDAPIAITLIAEGGRVTMICEDAAPQHWQDDGPAGLTHVNTGQSRWYT